MSYYVAKELHIRPNDILHGWGVAELIVAYGHYTNEIVRSEFKMWQNRPIEQKRGQPVPPEYHVHFHSPEKL